MPVTKKDLYIAGTVGELNKLAELPVKMSTTNSKILVKTADKMLKEAEQGDMLGDEERAYVLYMKYFNVVTFLKKSADYKKQKQYYDSLLGQKNLLKSIDKAEELAESLKERYGELEAKLIAEKLSPLDSDPPKIIGKPASDDTEEDKKAIVKIVDNQKEDIEPKVTPGEITPTSLYTLLQEQDIQLIIMDVRTEIEYKESHINQKCCINIPENIIPPGTTMTYIEKSLPEDSKSPWQQRGNVDHIIIMDWTSKLKDCNIGTTIRTLKDALFKYDSTVIIKSEPLVLDGGYDQWLLYYPQLTTNSNITRPKTDLLSSIPSLDFDYPDYDEAFVTTPTPDIANQKQPTGNNDQSQPSLQNSDLAQQAKFPRIDRSTKPKPSQNNTTAKPSNLTDNDKLNELKSNASLYPNASSLSRTIYPDTRSISGTKGIVGNKGETDGQKNSSSTSLSSELEREREELNKMRKEKEEEMAKYQHEKERIIKEQQAQIERLKEEENRLRAIEQKKSEQTRDLADLMRMKRGLQEEMNKGTREEEVRRQEINKMEDEKVKRQEEVEKLRLERKRKEEERKKLEEEKEKEELEQARARIRLEEEKKDVELKQAAQTAQHLGEEDEIREHELKQRELKTKIEEHRKAKELQKQQELNEEERKKKEILEASKKIEEEKRFKEKQERDEVLRKLEEDRKQKEKEEALKRQEEDRLIRERLEKETVERRIKELKEKEIREQEEEKKRLAKELEEKTRVEQARREAEEKLKLINAESPKIKTIPSPNLPTGWEKRLDGPTHRYYYINHNKGTTQWEPPQTALPAPKKYTTKLKDEPSTLKRGLSRSNSSPNIAKMMEDEERAESSGHLKPDINRSNKPMQRQLVPEINRPSPQKQAARFRNLNPVYGNVGRAITGLRNLGNTCYMNSTIQCLNNCSPLVTYFLTDSYLYDINRESELGSHGEVADDFAVIVKGLWCGQYKCMTPRDFKITVGKHQPMFAGNEQQDSQEFLTFLLDALHEGLNKVKIRPKIPEQDNDNLPDHVNAELSWKHHRMLHESIIVELFQGQLRSTLMCLTCRKQSVTFQAFMYLSLPIPSGSRCKLDDCLKQFLKEEKMSGSSRWRCPRCKVDRDSVKKIDIWKLPRILLIGLNRFVYDGPWRQKINAYVDFPVIGLNLNSVVQSSQSTKNNYNLYGISNHYGTMDGGHYTAFCRNPCTKKWYKYDDEQVYDMSESDVKSSAAFVLYYTSIELYPPDFRQNF